MQPGRSGAPQRSLAPSHSGVVVAMSRGVRSVIAIAQTCRESLPGTASAAIAAWMLHRKPRKLNALAGDSLPDPIDADGVYGAQALSIEPRDSTTKHNIRSLRHGSPLLDAPHSSHSTSRRRSPGIMLKPQKREGRPMPALLDCARRLFQACSGFGFSPSIL